MVFDEYSKLKEPMNFAQIWGEMLISCSNTLKALGFRPDSKEYLKGMNVFEQNVIEGIRKYR